MTGFNQCIYFSYMAKTVLNVKIDREVKEKAQKLAKRMGIPLSFVVGANLREFVREQRVEIREPLTPRPVVGRELLKAREDYRKGKNISPVFSSGEEMDKYLDI